MARRSLYLSDFCGVELHESPALTGARRALYDGRRIWLSPAMYALLDDADRNFTRLVAQSLEVVPVASLKRGLCEAF